LQEKKLDPKFEALFRKDFLSFARKALRELQGTKLGDEPYLKYLAKELDQFAKDKTHRLIVNLPPGHLKTSLGSVCLTAWLLAHDPSLKVMIVTHAEHLSKTIARNIREIVKSAWYREIFETRIKWGHAEVTDFGMTPGGGVFVTSFGSGFTGRRADVIIVDDPHDIGDDVERIAGAVETFNMTLLSRLNNRKNGRVLVIAHRVHESDLSAHLLSKGRRWKHVVLPLVATRDQTYETPSGTWLRCKGELLRPDGYEPEDIEEFRRNSFNPSFEMLYQQDCDFQALPPIERDHFTPFHEPPSPSAPVVLSVDAGMTNKPRSAFSVIQVWCFEAGRHFLLDQYREQCDVVELQDQIRRFRKWYSPVAILIERAANGHALISLLTRKYGKLVIPVDLDGRSKRARLLAHAQTILGRCIYIPTDKPWTELFIKEFVEFPKGKYTDQVDAATQYLDHAPELAVLPPRPLGGVAATTPRSGFPQTVSRSAGRKPGVVAAVRGDGTPVLNPVNGQRSYQGPIIKITSGVKY
jgi:predicted phage terminase large subunit-like protein